MRPLTSAIPFPQRSPLSLVELRDLRRGLLVQAPKKAKGSRAKGPGKRGKRTLMEEIQARCPELALALMVKES